VIGWSLPFVRPGVTNIEVTRAAMVMLMVVVEVKLKLKLRLLCCGVGWRRGCC
jgi:hypothetical protein